MVHDDKPRPMVDSDTQRTGAASGADPSRKKPYSPPVVIEYGRLEELTRQQSFEVFDGIGGTAPAA